jgi:hypothetical protein
VIGPLVMRSGVLPSRAQGELQAWLGHRTPNTTQHYAKITPNTLTKAYAQAGYFARNVRTIEVLLDRDAVTSSAARHVPQELLREFLLSPLRYSW